MENVNKLLYHFMSVVIFAVGVYLLIHMSASYNNVIKASKQALKTDIIYQEEISNEDIISYGKLIATLCMPLEYDIQIDGFMIYKNTHETYNIPEYNIIKSDYKRSYRYDDNGKLICIVYTRHTP